MDKEKTLFSCFFPIPNPEDAAEVEEVFNYYAIRTAKALSAAIVFQMQKKNVEPPPKRAFSLLAEEIEHGEAGKHYFLEPCDNGVQVSTRTERAYLLIQTMDMMQTRLDGDKENKTWERFLEMLITLETYKSFEPDKD